MKKATSTSFRTRSAKAVEDPFLGSVIQRATDRFAEGRVERLAELADADEQRDRARAAKLRAIENSEELIEAFGRQLHSRGGILHRVADGNELREALCALVEKEGVERVVKSKSMTTEETAVNEALQQVGAEVVETDLGEWIIQLAGESPSHIIVPAVHKDRDQVSELFREKLGTPRTRDIAALTNVARRELRTAFLGADMGITGANFLVSETGSIVLIENEGNARLVSSHPRIHVVVAGLDKLISEMRDLPNLLRVLIRSATGQRISSYVSIVSGPRRAQERDGPEQLHVFLLDGGRGALRTDPVLKDTLACLRCGACLNVCPVYRHTGGHAYGWTYPGPIGAVLSGPLQGLEKGGELAQASSLCGACVDACPVRIDLPAMLLELRARSVEGGPAIRPEGNVPFSAAVPGLRGAPPSAPSWLRRSMALYGQLVDQPARWRRATGWLRRVTRLVARKPQIQSLPGPAAGWSSSRDLPRPPAFSFLDRWERGLVDLGANQQTEARLVRKKAHTPATPRTLLTPSADTRSARFLRRLMDVGAEAGSLDRQDAVQQAVRWLEEALDGPILIGSGGGTIGHSVGEELVRIGRDVIFLDGLERESHHVIASASAALIFPLRGLAATGSLLEASGTGWERLASVLPGLVVALLDESLLFEELEDLQEELADASRTRAALWLSTGPSRTGDIELVHTIGVHGPAQLRVGLIRDEEHT